jgi:ribosomal protein S18 acetylase RimI-like enzyme
MPPPNFTPVETNSSLTPADISSAQKLVIEAGWNQVGADWNLFFALGHVLKVCSPAGSLDATAATLPYACGFGWISMVLVTKARQRQGLASALLSQCIDSLRSKGLVSVLDATPAGREVYRRLGFVDGWAISRWHRGAMSPRISTPAVSLVRPMSPHDLPAVAALDSAAFGCARPALLDRLYSRSDDFACLATDASGAPCGFLLGRDGRNATQLGPLVAGDEQTAIGLIDHALARNAGPVMIDVLDRQTHVTHALEARGCAIQRPFTRMTLDRATPFGDDRLMMAIAGPELG